MPVSTSPVKILLDLEIDLDNLSSEESYLSALIEATNILTITNSSDGRIPILQEEIKRVRGERVPAIKERRTRISASALFGRKSDNQVKKLTASSKKVSLNGGGDDSIANTLESILKRLFSIEAILNKQQKVEEKESERIRRSNQKKKRDDEETRLEKATKFLGKTAKKVVAPVQSIFSRIFKFLKVIFLGKILLNILNWFGNPENAKKIDSVVKFLGNNWGKLLSAYLVFGTGLGRFVQFITKTVIRGAIALTSVTAKLLAAKGVKGARGVFRATRGVKGGKLGTALSVVGTTAAVLGMGRMFQGDGGDVQEFSDGGQVAGVGNRDTVPAMLTPGEVVMSKGAVQKFGADNLLAMNAAGGGSNIPNFSGGMIGYNQGGFVDKNLQRLETRIKLSTLSPEKQAEIEKAVQKSLSNAELRNFISLNNNPFKRGVGGLADFMTLGMFDFDKRNRKGAPKDFGIRRIAGGLTDALTFGLTDFDKRGAGIAQVNPISGGEDKAWGSRNEQAKRREKQSGFGLKRGIGGALDFATLGMFDFDKQNRRGAPKGFGPLRMLGGLADAITAGATDFDKRGAGIGQMKLGEMMSNKRDRGRMMKMMLKRRGVPETIRSNSKVNGRFDINTGKSYINNQEVPIEQYLNFFNMSTQEKLRVYGQRYNKGGLVTGFDGGDSTSPTSQEMMGAVSEAMSGAPSHLNAPGQMEFIKQRIETGDFDYENPEHREQLVNAISPMFKKFVEDQNKFVDEDPEAFNGVRLKMDRDGRMPNFGEWVSNQSEAAFNMAIQQTQKNDTIPPEAKKIMTNYMAQVRRETIDDPDFRSDLVFDINKDVPGTAAYRLLMKAQADTTSPAAVAGISARDRAFAMNKMGYVGGGLVQKFNEGGLVGGGLGGLRILDMLLRGVQGMKGLSSIFMSKKSDDKDLTDEEINELYKDVTNPKDPNILEKLLRSKDGPFNVDPRTTKSKGTGRLSNGKNGKNKPKEFNEGGFVDALGKGANMAMIAMDIAALAGLLFPEPTTSALGAARLAMRFGGRGLGLARGARVGATGLKSGGFKALRGAKNLHTGSGGLLSPFGRGVYSAPNVGRVGSSALRPGTGAARYTKFGSNPLKSGSDIGGGVVGSIVPGGARRIGGIEPQSVVNPKMFQKGQKLFQKLQQGAYGKSATANRLRSQASMSGFKAGQSNIPIQNIPKFAEGGYTGPMTPSTPKMPVNQPTLSAPKVTVLPSRQSVNSPTSYQSSKNSIPQFSVGNGSSRKAKQLGITR